MSIVGKSIRKQMSNLSASISLVSPHRPFLIKDTTPENQIVRIQDLGILKQYQTIGYTLSTLEASYICAGIPWLPPTKKVTAFRQLNRNKTDKDQKRDLALEEALRIELVNVQTHVIESYCDDLDNLQHSQTNLQKLSIEQYSHFEQFAFTCVLCIVATITSAIFGAILIHNTTLIASLIISCDICAVTLGFALSCHDYRKANFATLLSREILRRQGKGMGLPMTPIVE